MRLVRGTVVKLVMEFLNLRSCYMYIHLMDHLA